MKVHADFTIKDMEAELRQRESWRSCGNVRVGEWLKKIAINLIKNDTYNKVIPSHPLSKYGPQVCYDEMLNIFEDSFRYEEIRWDLDYNSGDRTWTIENFIVPASFYNAMKQAEDANSERREECILHIKVNDIFEEMLVADNIENKTIAQWLAQFAEEKIKELCDMEDLRDVTVTIEPVLNLLSCGTHYSWKDIGHILRLSYLGAEVEFLLAIDGNNIKIKDIQLPATMKAAIELVNKEKEQGIKQQKEFTVGEMFAGLMLSKDYTVKLPYVEWLARAVQNLLNIKKEMPSDFSIHCTHGTKICFRDAMDDFVTHNEAGDKFKVIYSLSDEWGEEGNSAIKFYDIRKVEEDN